MSTERKEQLQVIRDGSFARRRRVVEFAPSTQDVILSRFIQFLWLVAAVVLVLLSFRFGFLLIGASAGNDFVDFVYSVTDYLIKPFTGIVNTPDTANGGVVDVASMIAMVVYFFATWLFTVLLRILFSTPKSYRNSTTVEIDS